MTFTQWLRLRLNGRTWCVAKVRRGRVTQKYEVVLLQREYDALRAEFDAI